MLPFVHMRQLEVSDVECDSLLPPELADWQPDASSDASLVEQLCAALAPYDDATAQRVSSMLAEGVVPVQLSVLQRRHAHPRS
jgi:hypothetical protein